MIERRTSAAKRNPVGRREILSPAPLSYSQELLWLLSQVFDDGVAYNVPGAYRLQGPLDLELLQRALDALIDRHEILRTTYSVIGDRPMQVIHERMRVHVNLIDLSGRTAEEQAAETATILKEESIHAFDLETGPVLRPTVIRHAADDHVFMLVLHHVATDGFSRAVLYRDLTVLYDAFAADEESPLAPLPIQYADFAIWHRTWLDGGAAETQLGYWKQQLANLPSRLELPTDFPRPRSRAYVGDYRSQMLDLSLRESLRSLARRMDATLFVALVALFGTLLHRYAGQDDIVIGTPFAGRNRTEFEEMVGYFINPLPLRLDFSGDPSFEELIGRTRGTVLDAFANADVPFETIVRETHPTRDLSQTPVFQTMIVLHNPAWETRRPKFEPTGIHATEMTHEKGWSKFDLLLGMSERTAGLNTTWEYSTELFDDPTIERMMSHFRVLAESAIAGSDRPVSRLSMLSTEERTRVLSSSDATQDAQESESVKDLFEERAERSPDLPAVVWGEERLTYDELNRSANRIAWRLKDSGVGPGSRVGIMMHKCVELVPAVLAVIKSGGAYVPLDPQYPKDRLDFMLQDARPEVVLTHANMLDEVDAEWATLIAVDDLSGDERADNPPTLSSGNDLAYVIYTSGSTGRPKGALITNRSLASAYFAYKDAYRLPELTSHLQMASFSFDVFTGDLIRSLLSGAKLVLCPLETVVDPASLFELMKRELVDAAEFVPATAAMLFDWASQNGERVDFMKAVIVSSEAWRNDQYTFFRSLCGPTTRLINSYGLTEATIDSTWYEPADDAILVPGRFVPIGRPLSNTKVYVLDANLEPLPTGIPGELCIGGVAVAQGYLNRPELTAERFVPNPYADGELLYRTGDLARRLPDGDIEFIGRADRQLKIRGFRIEPGEIEAVLERHDSIRKAVVTTRPDARGDARLVAYFTLVPQAPAPEHEELRDFVAEHVPAYMVPAGWAVVDSFLVTPNGKVNMDALPEPELAASRASEPLKTTTERELGEIWRRLLELEELPGADDDFFALGGHSLLAVRLVSEIDREFKVRIPIATLFKGATIAHLAEVLEGERVSRTAWSSLVPIREGGTRTPLFLGPYLDGDVFGYHTLVEHLDDDQPVYGLQSLGLDGRVHPQDRIEDMAAHYVREMRELQPHGPYFLAGYCFGGVVAYAMAVELHAMGEDVALLALIDAGPVGYRRAQPKSRRELERTRWSKFRNADARGKVAVVGHLLPGLAYKIRTRTRWATFDLLSRAGMPLPRALQNVEMVNRRAVSRFVTPPSECKVTLFRAEREATQSYYRLGFWSQLAGGGVAVHPIEGEGMTHFEIMKEPHVQTLAAELTRCIEEASNGTGPAG